MNPKLLKRMPGWGATVLRVAVGVVFLPHGYQKLFLLGIPAVATFLGRIGIPAPLPAAAILSLVEFGAGLALVLGIFTRWAAGLLAVDMLVAILTVHLPHGFFLPEGFEYAGILLAANLALVLLGPGDAALDGLLRPER
jgi:putative oxidoreductase